MREYQYPELPRSWQRDREFLALVLDELAKQQKIDAPEQNKTDRMKPRLIKKVDIISR